MTAVDGIDEVVLNLYGHFHLRRRHVFGKEFDAAFDVLVLIDEVSFPVVHHFLQGSDVLLRQGQHHFGLERDGVAHVATVPAGQASFALFDGLAYETHHHLICVAATFVNLKAGVSTTQTFQRHTDSSVCRVGFHLLIGQGSGHVDTTG